MGTVQMVSVCVRCVIQLTERDYEERITIWRTDDLDDAVAKAQAEARDYAANVGGTAIDFAQSYGSDEDPTEDGAEVFSLIRQSEMPPRQYIDHFFDTGMEFIRRDDD